MKYRIAFYDPTKSALNRPVGYFVDDSQEPTTSKREAHVYDNVAVAESHCQHIKDSWFGDLKVRVVRAD